MKKFLKAVFILVGLFACFAPYEFERKENGDFVYKAWFLGLSRKTNGEKRKYKIWFFNKPKLTGISFTKKSTLDASEFAVSDEAVEDVTDDIFDGISLDGLEDIFSELD